jgi:hypothetical protein
VTNRSVLGRCNENGRKLMEENRMMMMIIIMMINGLEGEVFK